MLGDNAEHCRLTPGTSLYRDTWWGATSLGTEAAPWGSPLRWDEQSLPQKRASYKTRWEDPVGLDVNWVKSKVRFTYDQSNSRVYYQSGSVENHWLIASGWLHNSDDLTSSWYYRDGNQRVVVEGDDHFWNPVFCNETLGVPVTDHVYYEDNRVVGTWSGIAWGQSNSWVTGFCANLLLHEEYVLEVN